MRRHADSLCIVSTSRGTNAATISARLKAPQILTAGSSFPWSAQTHSQGIQESLPMPEIVST